MIGECALVCARARECVCVREREIVSENRWRERELRCVRERESVCAELKIP